MPKCSILAPPWHPAVPKMTAKVTQVAPKVVSENSLGNYYLRNCSQGRFRIGPGHQCDRFRMDFAWILDGFWMDLDEIGHNCFRVVVAFSAAAFAECQGRAGTKRTNGKRQEHADICRNMQKKQRKLKRVNKRSDRELASCKM